MKKTIGSVLAAASLAAGFGFAAAAPANAAYWAADTVRFEHASGGLSGGMGIQFKNGIQASKNVGWFREGPDDIGDTPRYIKAGSGYCVWEELFHVRPDGTRFKWGDYNYGKNVNTGQGYASQYWEIQAYRNRITQDRPEGLYRIYQC